MIPADMKRAPRAVQRTEGSETCLSTTQTTPTLPVLGRLRLDLRGLNDKECRERVQRLNFAPKGVTAVLVVSKGLFPPFHDIWYLIEQQILGNVVIEADDPSAVQVWIDAFNRTGVFGPHEF